MNRLLLSLAFVFLPLTHAAAQLAVQAEMLYTMAGAPLKNGVVLIKDGKIEAVGANLTIPNGYRTLKAKVVTPGLIDAHSVVGLAGILNYNHDQDQLELSEAIQPELRAEDAYNAEERLVKWIRDHGVTTVHTGHGPGALASGQTMIVKTDANTVTEAIVQTPAMVAFTLGTSVSQNYKKPGTRAKGKGPQQATGTRLADGNPQRSLNRETASALYRASCHGYSGVIALAKRVWF